jgi:protein-tyrosine phosphatase
VLAPAPASRQAPPIDDRHLQWDGCFDVHDLGGLPAADGRAVRRGALVRADSLTGLTAAGWDEPAEAAA